MRTLTSINRPVDITSLGFGRNMRTYPRRMEFGGSTYDFIDAGLRMVVQSGGRVTQIFTMSDGLYDFRLRNDGDDWTLLTMG